MKHKRIIFAFLILLLISFMSLYIFAQGVGYIQIKCEPGAMVFLDDDFMGNTSLEYKGLILQDVPAGSHIIRIVKEGFEPQSVKIDLKANDIFYYEVKEFIPKRDIIQAGEADTDTIKQKVGSLLIETIPVECIIEIPDLYIDEDNQGDKTLKTWNYSNIPVGSYKVYFIAMGKKLEYTCKIEEGIQKHLLVNILKNEVKEILPPPITYKVFFSVDSGEGKIIVTAEGNLINSGDSVEEGAKVIIKATPDAGQKVKSWKVNRTEKSTNSEGIYIIENLKSDIDFEVIFDLIPYKIRKGPAGGWVFYDKGEYTYGWRYLEAAPASTEWKSVKWGSEQYKIGGTKRSIGSGKTNTEKLIKKQGRGDTYAAQLCDALVYGGYSDWFLPSIEELDLMYKNLKAADVGGFARDTYWSSTEGSSVKNAYYQYFGSGRKIGLNKRYKYQVRAVRAF